MVHTYQFTFSTFFLGKILSAAPGLRHFCRVHVNAELNKLLVTVDVMRCHVDVLLRLKFHFYYGNKPR